uniref:Uncharacterized protein n=1 Tax=viral metagenome TaxID=1070528 RepID=A0A6M3KT45_9ZZZZ
MTDWSIFWCLKSEELDALNKYQVDTYGVKIAIPPLPKAKINVETEGLQELTKIMKWKPNPMRRVE